MENSFWEAYIGLHKYVRQVRQVGTDTKILWQSVLGEIEVSLSPANFSTWFKNTTLLEHQKGQAVIGVPNIFAKRQLEEKFSPLILKTLKRMGINASSIVYRLRPLPTSQAPTFPSPVSPSLSPSNAHPNLNPRYSFDNFIVGDGNELAYTAALAVTRQSGHKYNPLFIYGGVGLGKTHLIQALGNEVLKHQPNAKIIYTTCERFLKDFVGSILSKRPFSDRYRTADVLIVDDIQFIAGKERAQEEFFHTFNSLHEANKQIVMSSDKPPRSIPTLQDRLHSRFDGGMTIDIQPPDFETRVAILEAKIKGAKRTVPADVVEFLATHIQSNIRELEGTLTKLFAHCEMRGLVPSLELVEQMINPPTIKAKSITAERIIAKAARHFGVSVNEIRSPKRDKHISEPRQICMYLMRAELSMSYPQIARQVGRSDHTTAIHSVNKIERSILNNHYLRRSIFELKEKLYV